LSRKLLLCRASVVQGGKPRQVDSRGTEALRRGAEQPTPASGRSSARMPPPASLSAPLVPSEVDAEVGRVPGKPWQASRPSTWWRGAATAALILAALAPIVAITVFAKAAFEENRAGASGGDAANAAQLPLPAEHGYDEVQFLGFNLFTAPGGAADGCFGEWGEELERCYLGSDKNEEDISKREDIMMKAIERTFNSSYWARSSNTLKVFVAPEFFWRGARGAYRVQPNASARSRSLVHNMTLKLQDHRFRHWLFVLGTIVAAQVSRVDVAQKPDITFYNFAPLQLGGTNMSYVQFKHFISSIDFLQAAPGQPRSNVFYGPPPHSSAFCREHPDSKVCVYKTAPPNLLADFGFGRHQLLEDGVLRLGGVKIGMEICLDHLKGQLCSTNLEATETVDVQIISSAGMAIADGPVCTRPGGPVFVCDGFARTELSFNHFGHGRQGALMPDARHRRYDVGLVYGADALMSLTQHVTDTVDSFIYNVTGLGFGGHFPGQNTLPGGSTATGQSGVRFSQINALGDDWLDQISGYFDVAPYLQANKIAHVLEESLDGFVKKEGASSGLGWSADHAGLHPTVDFYGPIAIGGRAAAGS